MRVFAIVGDSQAEGIAEPLKRRLAARGFVSAGKRVHSGWSTASFLASRDLGDILGWNVDLLIVFLGGNDIVTESLAPRYAEFVERLKQGGRAPYVVWFGPAFSRIADVQARKARVADTQRLVLPALGVEWHDAIPMTRDLEHGPDGVHFTAQARARWAERVDFALFSTGTSVTARMAVGAALVAAAFGLAGVAWLVLR